MNNMKVLIYGNILFSNDLFWGFSQLECSTQVVTTKEMKDIFETFFDFKPDLVVTLGAPLELNFKFMAMLRERPKSIKHIHWDTDGISSLRYPSFYGDGIEMDVIYLSRPDLVFTMCGEMCDFIRKKGFVCELMQYAYSPVSHRSMPELQSEDQKLISLVGNSYSEFYPNDPEHYRYQSLKILVKPLIENGYTVNIYGDKGYLPLMRESLGINLPEQNYQGRISYHLTCAVYNLSFINIVTQNHQDTITKRTFEILGSGGFVLSSDNSGLRNLFVPGRDLEVSSSPEQTLELVKYYEKNMNEWREIRKNALESVKNHTYKQRALEMLTHLNRL